MYDSDEDDEETDEEEDDEDDDDWLSDVSCLLSLCGQR